ncbi:MAG: hypothetical protein LBM92_03870 [Opitutaceae bacterium]|jgi:hypothetical protein|nr:hypothetical protein [Opitutaceae bacterium]
MSDQTPEQPATRRHFITYLAREGFRPKLMPDGDIVFHFEGREYFLQWDEGDPQLARIALVNFRPIENEGDFKKVAFATQEVTRRIKVVKMYVADDDTWCVVELFLAEPDRLTDVFGRTLSAIRSALTAFEMALAGKLKD